MVFYFHLVHSFFIFQLHVDFCYFICYFISIVSAVLFKRFAEKVILFEILFLILSNISNWNQPLFKPQISTICCIEKFSFAVSYICLPGIHLFFCYDCLWINY